MSMLWKVCVKGTLGRKAKIMKISFSNRKGSEQARWQKVTNSVDTSGAKRQISVREKNLSMQRNDTDSVAKLWWYRCSLEDVAGVHENNHFISHPSITRGKLHKIMPVASRFLFTHMQSGHRSAITLWIFAEFQAVPCPLVCLLLSFAYWR